MASEQIDPAAQTRIEGLFASYTHMSARMKWAFLDQALVSASNLLVGILVARTLGLYAFGIYSLVRIGLQLVATLQMAAIISPMLTSYDRRGGDAREVYLTTILLHQTVLLIGLSIVGALCLGVLGLGFAELDWDLPLSAGLIGAVVMATQVQDLVRRFFYATERPGRAFVSDLLSYAGRFIVILVLIFFGELTLASAFYAIVAANVIALLPAFGDLRRLQFSWPAVKRITRMHNEIGGWLVGSAIVQWFSGDDFFFLVVAALAGPEALGGARAVQNLIAITHILLQALENFVPSQSTRVYLDGGARALTRYIWQVALVGGALILVATAILLLFADPIMQLVYSQGFEGQVAILFLFGVYYVLGHVTFSVSAGLRTLGNARSIFWAYVIAGAGSLAIVYPITVVGGVIGALIGLVVVRFLIVGWLATSFRHTLTRSS